MSTLNTIGIDTETSSKLTLMRRLKRLKTTVRVGDGGEYAQDRSYSQVVVQTTWTEEELDAWLYKTKGIDYVGTFHLSTAQQ